jgi:hypothetical protein
MDTESLELHETLYYSINSTRGKQAYRYAKHLGVPGSDNIPVSAPLTPQDSSALLSFSTRLFSSASGGLRRSYPNHLHAVNHPLTPFGPSVYSVSSGSFTSSESLFQGPARNSVRVLGRVRLDLVCVEYMSYTNYSNLERTVKEIVYLTPVLKNMLSSGTPGNNIVIGEQAFIRLRLFDTRNRDTGSVYAGSATGSATGSRMIPFCLENRYSTYRRGIAFPFGNLC